MTCWRARKDHARIGALRAAERESGRCWRQRGSEMIAERGPSGRLSLRGSFE